MARHDLTVSEMVLRALADHGSLGYRDLKHKIMWMSRGRSSPIGFGMELRKLISDRRIEFDGSLYSLPLLERMVIDPNG